MKMKQIYIILSLCLLASCSSEDYDSPLLPGGEALQLSVRAGDFVTDGAPNTRATDSGATTTFENNDRIGIIVLDNNSNVLYDNIPYIYNGSTWSFDSNNDEGKNAIYYDNQAGKLTYLAYFPYSKAADGAKDEADLKTKFQPQTDQRSKDAYRASDLLVWSKTSDNPLKKLAIEFSHAYSSLSLFPSIKYKIDGGTEKTYVPSVSDVSFTIGEEPLFPYQASDGSYRMVVSPKETVARWLYACSDKMYSGTMSSTALSANTRYTLTPTIDIGEYGLDKAKVGDFYCSAEKADGTTIGYLIPCDAVAIPEGTNCIGIVFWTGDATSKDKTLKTYHKGCTHGLVVALTEESSVWQSPYRDKDRITVQNWLDANKSNMFLPVQSGIGATDPLNNIQGYNNTKAIEEYNAADANSGYVVQAIQKVVEYRSKVPAPSNSSDWYLPSEKELTLLCGKEKTDIGDSTVGTDNKNTINSKLQSVSGATQLSSSNYWSSTEYKHSMAYFVRFSDGFAFYYYKSASSYPVRCVLAF